MSSDIKSVSEQIDDIIAKPNDWRSNTLAQLRAVMTQSGLAIDEEVKWKKPSKPEGIPFGPTTARIYAWQIRLKVPYV